MDSVNDAVRSIHGARAAQSRAGSVEPTLRILVTAFLVCSNLAGLQCCPPASYYRVYEIRGRVLDEENMLGLTDTMLGGTTFIDGEETGFRGPSEPPGYRDELPPSVDGAFAMRLSFSKDYFGTFCDVVPFAFGSHDAIFPPPDEVEIVIVRAQCERRLRLEINADTAIVTVGFDTRIELSNPILVPPCAP